MAKEFGCKLCGARFSRPGSLEIHFRTHGGTPETLTEAIGNGTSELIITPRAEETIRKHVRDFLSQKFSAHLLTADHLTVGGIAKLWKDITGEEL